MRNMQTKLILKVAVPRPLYTIFDYLPPLTDTHTPQNWQIGMRLKIPFGKQQTTGWLVALSDHSEYQGEELKQVIDCLDESPLLPAYLLDLLQWTADYYHYPLGLTIHTAVPTLLNQGKAKQLSQLVYWRLEIKTPSRIKYNEKQQCIIDLLKQYPQGLSQTKLNQRIANASTYLKTKHGQLGIIKENRLPLQAKHEHPQAALSLNAEQAAAVDQVKQAEAGFYCYVLDGVTGSGKTEVYLHLIQHQLDQGKQVLVLIPEINLTPQTLARFEARFAVAIALFHSNLTDRQRCDAWLMASQGQTPIVIGTRSAVWTPLPNLGLIVIDEEHDPSYKQQEGLLYSARDVAIVRAKRAAVPIVLGSATPSLQSLYNLQQAHYQHLTLLQRAANASLPDYELLDMRQQRVQQGISHDLQLAIQTALAAQQQVLIYINRRGYAPSYMCHQCGWVSDCPHCSAHHTYHSSSHRLHCHHCGHHEPPPLACPQCKHDELHCLGYGSQRITEALQGLFPHARIVRIDSDTTRHKQALPRLLDQINQGQVDIMVGTQMLAKGHHFPLVSLVGVVNIDSGLFSVDFRAAERMAQGLIQVAGRAGRAQIKGKVLIQTHHPDNSLLQLLTQQDYSAFAQQALVERYQAQFPPYSHLVVLHAEAKNSEQAQKFLEYAVTLVQQIMPNQPQIQVFGPIDAPLQRRADYHRCQVLVQAPQRPLLHQLLSRWVTQLNTYKNKRIKWKLDVDPQDLF